MWMVRRPGRNAIRANIPDLADSHPTEKHVKIPCAGLELVSPVHLAHLSKPSEEQKEITWADSVILEMSLSLV
jgi:hypothetical protein